MTNADDGSIAVFPCMAALEVSFRRFERESVNYCSGALISKTIVLTSASCLDYYLPNGGLDEILGVNVYLGTDVYRNHWQLRQKKHVAKEWFGNPAFNRDRLEWNNIGAVRLQYSVGLIENLIDIIPLQREKLTVPADTEALAAGWGSDNHLKIARMTVLDKNKCSFKAGSTVLCTSGRAELCDVDLGGPLVANGKLIGVYVGAKDNSVCTKKGGDALFTDISRPNIRDFINLTLSGYY